MRKWWCKKVSLVQYLNSKSTDFPDNCFLEPEIINLPKKKKKKSHFFRNFWSRNCHWLCLFSNVIWVSPFTFNQWKIKQASKITLVSPQIKYFDNDHFVETQNTGSNIKGIFWLLKVTDQLPPPKWYPLCKEAGIKNKNILLTPHICF